MTKHNIESVLSLELPSLNEECINPTEDNIIRWAGNIETAKKAVRKRMLAILFLVVPIETTTNCRRWWRFWR